MPKARNISDVVHADLVQLHDGAGRSYWGLNIVDAASGYQVVSLLPDKSTRSVVDVFERSWIVFLRSPSTLVVDMGPEFTSVEFSQWCELHGIILHHIPVGLLGRTVWLREPEGHSRWCSPH